VDLGRSVYEEFDEVLGGFVVVGVLVVVVVVVEAVFISGQLLDRDD